MMATSSTDLWIPLGFIGGLLVAFYCAGSIFFMRTTKAKAIRAAIAAAGVAFALTCMAIDPSGSRPADDRNAWASLKTIATAQIDFRSNDRDDDGKPNFWRKDIAGLYALQSKNGSAIKLIDVSIACADDRPKSDVSKLPARGPKVGFWYRALRFADEKEPDPDRFAACAFPDSPGVGRYTYIISHEATVYRKKGLLRDLEVFPADPLKEGWERAD